MYNVESDLTIGVNSQCEFVWYLAHDTTHLTLSLQPGPQHVWVNIDCMAGVYKANRDHKGDAGRGTVTKWPGPTVEVAQAD
jgi:hypothetical protein